MKKIVTISFIIIIAFLMSPDLLAQKNETLKNQAVQQMRMGRYGEAINLLNRYISANPQNPSGYNLRGLAYEKRATYNMAVYDFKSALKLAPNDEEINKNLSRATRAWEALLYNKIEGHKREIAINPNIPRNYLEIGKSYKNLGEWAAAEDWYDQYLAREEASADEIIRYSEILAKNNHIQKGEPILKRYTEKYPEDHRLWSRYGYFTMWLGKNNIAIDAFENALALRPYFKEAIDGLDLARGKGYVYTINDTSSRHNYGMPSYTAGAEFAIDKYYRQLRKNPDDDELRFKLVEELIAYDRYGEAYDQLTILMKSDTTDVERYQEYWEAVKEKRDSIYQIKIDEYKNLVSSDPTNKEAVIQLADYYAGLQEYDSALEIFDNYLASNPGGDNSEIRFRYAKYATWNYEFERAIEQLEILLAQEPNNLDYQLLRAQIAVWTVQDMDLAEEYLNNILQNDPDNLQALVSLASLKIRQTEFATAKDYLDRAKTIDPKSKEVEAIQIYYDVSLSNYEGLQIYQILYDARDLVAAGDCEGALDLYEDYFSKITAPTRLEKYEYANVNVCAENYETALDIYDELLAEEYDYDMAVMRAKTMLWTGDSAGALVEFKELQKQRPDDFDANLNLAVAYEYNHMWDEAEDIYDRLLEEEKLVVEETGDSTRIKTIQQRQEWLPESSFGGFAGSFPNYMAIVPQANFYVDNQDFSFSNVGGRFDLGLTSFLTAGLSYMRTNLSTNFASTYLSEFMGHIFVNITDNLTAHAGFGTLTSQYYQKRNVNEAWLRYEVKDEWAVQGSYENTDARLLLYSPNLVSATFDADLYRINGYYNHPSGLILSGLFDYLTISDGNEGNNFRLRIGKRFYEDLKLGYEYFYSNYSFDTFFYYSPQNFQSHSIWFDWLAVDEEKVDFNVGGRLGYVPLGDYIIRELFGQAEYKPFDNFIINGKATVGSTFRFNTSYDYFSFVVSAYWSFY